MTFTRARRFAARLAAAANSRSSTVLYYLGCELLHQRPSDLAAVQGLVTPALGFLSEYPQAAYLVVRGSLGLQP